MGKRLKEHPLISLIVVAIVVMLLVGFWPQPILVEVVTVTKAPLTVAIEEDGQTRLIDRYRISAPVAGVASRVEFEVGDAVAKGQTLLNITPLAARILDPRSRAQAVAEIAAAQAALLGAEQQVNAVVASKDLADNELRRLRTLMQRQLVAQDSLDRATADAASQAAALRSAQFNVEVRRYELQARRSTLEYQTLLAEGEAIEPVLVRAPVAGEVLKIHHECEGPVDRFTLDGDWQSCSPGGCG